MNTLFSRSTVALATALACAMGGYSSNASAQLAEPGPLVISQSPLFVATPQPPLNMLVMGRDHKLYYEAYNDSSDLNGDGELDIGYKGDIAVFGSRKVDYFGLFDSYKCYVYGADNIYAPTRVTANKRCGGTNEWSGDFLNYLTTSRIDALKKVLYGGTRSIDTATRTVLERERIPQDGHSWGKEYQGIARDGYDIRQYAPLTLPVVGKRHLFANASMNDDLTNPRLRILPNSGLRIWNWVSIEGPVAGDNCVPSGNGGGRGPCEVAAAAAAFIQVPASEFSGLIARQWDTRVLYPNGHPDDEVELATWVAETGLNTPEGTAARTDLWTGDQDGDGSIVAGRNNNYLLRVEGLLRVDSGVSYRFAVDGDDAVEVRIGGARVAGWYGGHGFCAGGDCPIQHSDGSSLAGSYTATTTGFVPIELRMQETQGGDGYRLRWERTIPESRFIERMVRVEVCTSAALIDSDCKLYPNGNYKPTGLLHEFGENNQMMFGLLMGSFTKNTEGGVLRKNVSSFQDEVNSTNGVFQSITGIVSQIDKLRIVGYPGTNRNNNSNYNDCGGIGFRAIVGGECKDWGNPIGEMVYESLRYFSGAPGGAIYNYPLGTSVDNTLGLIQAGWKDPYAPTPGGLGYRTCAKPFNTVISDINPSYDSQVPSGIYGSPPSPSSTDRTEVTNLDAGTLANNIWTMEFGATSKNIFIGENAIINDGAPTPKAASSFSNIRGLAPEEPTKEGNFYVAATSYYGLTRDVNPIAGQQNIQTFSVALASPLPRIEFPVDGRVVTLIPFAKSVAHTGNTGNFRIPQDANFRPTNTIVDFYIEALVNVPGQPTVPAVNGGRPYGVFRINYEDVEQGNDHDMDAIVRYEISVTAANTLVVNLATEYEAGSVVHHMGYVISGTTQDGVYLEIVDEGGKRPSAGSTGYARYKFDTPPGLAAGACDTATPLVSCPVIASGALLPTSATRTFTPGTAGTNASLLKDPLWYAAKFGGFTDNKAFSGGTEIRGDRIPQGREWDENADGTPDNYFLVTNALTLKQRLRAAFQLILDRSAPAGAVATNSTRIDVGSLAYLASYDARDWTGDVVAVGIERNGRLGTQAWSAAARLPVPSARKIFYRSLDNAVREFNYGSMTVADQALFVGTGAGTVADRIAQVNNLRGEALDGSTGYRRRSKAFGDVINSSPAVSAKQDFGYSRPGIVGGTTYNTYLATVKQGTLAVPGRPSVLVVGSNDGMYRVLNAEGGAAGGTELFAYVPRAVLPNMAALSLTGYSHRFYVDGIPTIGDAYLGGAWKTVAIGSTGAGGRSVFAIDITSPTTMSASSAMWEFTDPDLGATIGQPRIALIGNKTRWVAIFGNGYNSDNQRGFLFIVDLETGALIRKIDTGVGSLPTVIDPSGRPNGIGTVAVIDTSGVTRGGVGETTRLAPLEFDRSGDVVYGGDLHGNMWKFDVSSTNVANWGVSTFGASAVAGPLYTAIMPASATPVRLARRQQITASPEVVAHPLGGVIVGFGTGRYFAVGDSSVQAEKIESFYALHDRRFTPSTLALGASENIASRPYATTPPLLVGQTLSEVAGGRRVSENTVDYRFSRGWFSDLNIVGERVVSGAVARGGFFFYSTFIPSGSECDPSAGGYLLVQGALSGTGGLLDGTAGGVGLPLPSGTPPAQPTIIGSPSDSEVPQDYVLINDGGATLGGVAIPPIKTVRGRQSWRQLR